MPYTFLPVRPQSPHMSLLGALQGLSYALCQSIRKCWNRRKLGRGSARFHSLAYQITEQDSISAGLGQHPPRRRRKSGELRGAQRSLAKYDLNLFRLYFATTYAEKQLSGEERSLMGRREDLPGRQPSGKEIILTGRRENLPGR